MKSLIIISFIAFVTASIVSLVYWSRPDADKTTPNPVVPVLEVAHLKPQRVPLVMTSQGNVYPSTQTTLSAEVVGRVVEVADVFESGETFKQGDMLLRLDVADYEANLAQKKALLAQAQLSLAQEEAAATQALRDWEKLGRGEATALTLRKPQLESARAQLESAEAAVQKALRDLERTRMVAPYDGRVVKTFVDLGDYVSNVGQALATIYASDVAEVRLPLDGDQYALLDLNAGVKPEVTLRAHIINKDYIWKGVIDRSESTVDERTRLHYVVAQIEKPFERLEDRPALKPGMFLKAQIIARHLEDAFVIPRAALLDRETVLIVDEGDTLRRRHIEVLFADTQEAIITEGLASGDRIVVTPLEFVVEGMPVKVEDVDMEKPKSVSDRPALDGERVYGLDNGDNDR